jgi:hypothetical protein
MMPDDQTATEKARRERFVRVATRRTKQLLKDIQRLGNCANRGAYEYKDVDVLKIFSAIEAAVASARARFEPRSQRKEVEFSIE